MYNKNETIYLKELPLSNKYFREPFEINEGFSYIGEYPEASNNYITVKRNSNNEKYVLSKKYFSNIIS